MSSLTRDVLEAIRDGLAVDLTVADLSVAGRVLIGVYDQPPTTGPFVCISPGTISTTEGHSLREWGASGSVEILVWAPAASQSSADRILAVVDLGGAVVARLWSIMVGSPVAPFTTDAIYNQQISVQYFDASEFAASWSGWGVASVVVSYDIAPNSGAI